MYKLLNWDFSENGGFFRMKNDDILEDSSDYFNPIA